jgi:cobalt-zinc-cadmium efflux system protein
MMVVEFVGGLLFGSLMLISDAIHMLSHAAALGVSLLAVWLAHRITTSRLSFGLYRVEIVAAFVNGIGLAGFSLWIVWEGIERILNPIAVQGPQLTVVALAGLAVNLTTAVILARAGLEDLNTKSAFLHMLADTFSSVAIVIGGVVISFTGWVLLDPLLSIVVAGMVARWSWGLLRDSTLILLEARPSEIGADDVRTGVLQAFPEIRDVHDLHVWEITSQYVCLSGHVVIDDAPVSEANHVTTGVREFLREHFGIAHVVLQVES